MKSEGEQGIRLRSHNPAILRCDSGAEHFSSRGPALLESLDLFSVDPWVLFWLSSGLPSSPSGIWFCPLPLWVHHVL